LNINDIFRVGEVVETDPDKCMVRVKFPDADELVSGWLQVLQRQTLKNKNYYMPDIEELVACIFLGNGSVAGFVMGAVYNDKDTPPYNGQDSYYTEYGDKTLFQYERRLHEMQINLKGNINATVDGNEGGEESEAADGTADFAVKDAITIKGKSLTVTVEEGKVIEAKEITIKASGDITIEAGGNLFIKSTGNAAIESTGSMDINSTGVFTIGKMAPATPGQGPLNCMAVCPMGPPHGGNSVA
jgi:phage baseplate assembly protein V